MAIEILTAVEVALEFVRSTDIRCIYRHLGFGEALNHSMRGIYVVRSETSSSKEGSGKGDNALVLFYTGWRQAL